jgi:hypothetical protein
MRETGWRLKKTRMGNIWSAIYVLKYRYALALKRSWNYSTRQNPNTGILGMSNASTPILGIEHDGTSENVTRHDKKRQMTW